MQLYAPWASGLRAVAPSMLDAYQADVTRRWTALGALDSFFTDFVEGAAHPQYRAASGPVLAAAWQAYRNANVAVAEAGAALQSGTPLVGSQAFAAQLADADAAIYSAKRAVWQAKVSHYLRQYAPIWLGLGAVGVGAFGYWLWSRRRR